MQERQNANKHLQHNSTSDPQEQVRERRRMTERNSGHAQDQQQAGAVQQSGAATPNENTETQQGQLSTNHQPNRDL